jgi:LysR family nitrogen assimilation transcriptional regulator
MNLKQLRYFVRIAECGSLSKASEALGIAQPALSQQLRALESELGVDLVMRHSRGVAPNDVGLMMLHHFMAILNEVDRTQDLVRDYTLNPSGEVRLGVTTTAARALTAPLVAKVHEQFPRIVLHVVEAMSGSLSESLHLGHLDLTLIYNPTLLGIDSNIDYTPMLKEELFLISKNKEQVGNRKAVPFSILQELPLVIPCYPNVLARLLHDLAAKSDIKLNVKFEIDSLSSIIELIDAEFFTVLPLGGVRRELEEGRVVATPITDPPLYWNVHVAAARKGVRSRAVRAVHRLLVDVMEDMVESGAWPARLL